MLSWEGPGHEYSTFSRAVQGTRVLSLTCGLLGTPLCPKFFHLARLRPSVSEPLFELSQCFAHSRCSLNLGKQKNECVHLYKYSFHKYQCSLCASLSVGVGAQKQSDNAQVSQTTGSSSQYSPYRVSLLIVSSNTVRTGRALRDLFLSTVSLYKQGNQKSEEHHSGTEKSTDQKAGQLDQILALLVTRGQFLSSLWALFSPGVIPGKSRCATRHKGLFWCRAVSPRGPFSRGRELSL